jgi:hypothetical protein
MILIYHYHANNDVAKGEQTPREDCEQKGDYYSDLVEIHEDGHLKVLVDVVEENLVLKFLCLLLHRLWGCLSISNLAILLKLIEQVLALLNLQVD